MDNLTAIIGNNLIKLRKEKSYSLDQVAQLTGVSKSMLSQIEKGQKTPTVTTLWKIANGLNTSLSLLMKDGDSAVQVIRSSVANPLYENDGKYMTCPFIPFEDETKFEVFRMVLEPGCVHESNPHFKGTKEYLFVSTGIVEVEIEGSVYRAAPGEAVVFPGEVHHIYRNISDVTAETLTLFHYSSR